MFKLSKKVILQNCRLLIDSTELNAGENHTSVLFTDTLDPNIYPIRHVILNGEFSVNFPNSNEPNDSDTIGVVFPSKIYLANSYQIVSQMDNSIYYCVIPSKNEKLIQNTKNLNVGESMTVKLGQLAFIFGSEFTVNSVKKNNLAVIACENNPAKVVATKSCKVVTFHSSYYTI
jgi:hypothetical protein